MTNPPPNQLFGRWIVERMPDSDGALTSPLADTRIVAEFGSDGSIAGNAGCNVFRGSFEVAGDSITIDRVATTMKMCGRPEGVMEQEARVLSALERASSFTIDAGALHLLDDAATPVMSMTREPPEPA